MASAGSPLPCAVPPSEGSAGPIGGFQRQQFGVDEQAALSALGGVGGGDDPIVEDDDRANRQLALLEPCAGNAQRLAHEEFGRVPGARHDGPSE